MLNDFHFEYMLIEKVASRLMRMKSQGNIIIAVPTLFYSYDSVSVVGLKRFRNKHEYIQVTNIETF